MLIKPWLRGVLWRFPGGLNCIAGDVSYYCDLDTRDVYLIGYVSVCWGGPLRIVLVASKQAIPATTLPDTAWDSPVAGFAWMVSTESDGDRRIGV